MSSPSFEPEVLALLDEIARSSEGRLLRIPRHRFPAYAGDPAETVTPHGSFLSRAERHLIRGYREEAAQVLLHACILQLGKRARIYSTREGSESAMRARAKPLAARLASEADVPRTLSSLAEGHHATFTELAIASVRLAPCDLGFSTLANCYQQEEWFRSSLRVLARFLDGGATSERRAQGFANMAQTYSLQGDHARAYECGLQAARFDGEHCRFAIWCMTDALQGGNEAAVLASAQLLDRGPEQEEYDRVLRLLRRDRERGAWTPTAASQTLSAELRPKLSPRSGAICESFS